MAKRGCHRDFDAELVRFVCLALADALHFGGVERINLRTALAWLLIADASCQRQDVLEHHLLKPEMVCNLAIDVANDAAQIGF